MTTRTHYYHRRMARRLTDAERDARIERVTKWAVRAVLVLLALLTLAGYWALIKAGIAAGRIA